MSGFALLGLAVCFFLPFGAIGAIDASFSHSVAVPHPRPTTQHHGRQAGDRTARADDAHLAPPTRLERSAASHVPVFRRLAVPLDPLLLGLLLGVVVVFAIAATTPHAPANTPLLARPPSRGPPFAC